MAKRHLIRALVLTAGPGRTVDISLPLKLAADRLVLGMYRIELAGAEERGVTAARISVVAGPSLDEQRAKNKERLAKIGTPSADLAEALASCQARNALLTDRPSDTNSAQFLADLHVLASDVTQEVDALASGKDPYIHRRGDYWRVMTTANGEIPLRVYAPEKATQDEPVPLLVVLHGAGGDENMFLEAYGVGVIKKIADEKGLLIASPLTYRFGGSPQNLDKLLDVLSHDYAIDRHRIYVLGHSMGAGVVAGLAQSSRSSCGGMHYRRRQLRCRKIYCSRLGGGRRTRCGRASKWSAIDRRKGGSSGDCDRIAADARLWAHTRRWHGPSRRR